MLVKAPGGCGPPNPPSYGTHYSRVECVVVDEKTGHVLMVHERIGTMAQCRKLVTGSVDAGEYISEAAQREVMEETGVSAKFAGVVGLVNRIGTRFGRDELLVGCLLIASPSGQTPMARSAEIVGAEWMPVKEAIGVGSNYMGRHWLCSVANLAMPSQHQTGLEERTLEDFRGHGHCMKMYAAL
jgi:8-oxo-dGTP pyrophosphatase MutT (NUDIX family)